ncbi:hypothetical protein ACFL08_01980 [Patescibacteria group bacterium]
MKIKKGHKRIVIFFKNFVIKIAIIHFISAIKNTIYLVNRGIFWRMFIRFNYRYSASIRGNLFAGPMENLNERLLFKKTKSSLLVPTYFSFLGIVNVQKRVKSLNINSFEFRSQMCKLTNDEAYADKHHFFFSENFSKSEEGYLQMIDYGNYKCNNVIIKYGEKIQKEFDFSFKRK